MTFKTLILEGYTISKTPLLDGEKIAELYDGVMTTALLKKILAYYKREKKKLSKQYREVFLVGQIGNDEIGISNPKGDIVSFRKENWTGDSKNNTLLVDTKMGWVSNAASSSTSGKEEGELYQQFQDGKLKVKIILAGYPS